MSTSATYKNMPERIKIQKGNSVICLYVKRVERTKKQKAAAGVTERIEVEYVRKEREGRGRLQR